MMTGVAGSLGSLKLLLSRRTQPSSLPPTGVAAMVADAAPLWGLPLGVVKATRPTLMLQVPGRASGELLME
jgi:hypothetical protein